MAVRHLESRPSGIMDAVEAAWLKGLSDREQSFVAKIMSHQGAYPAGHELLRAGSKLEAPFILRTGWACRSVILADGRRQILDLYLPGDLVGYSSRLGARAAAACLALTPVHISPAAALLACLEKPTQYRALLAALHDREEIAERRLVMQVVRMGHQSAVERLASLLLELHERAANTIDGDGATFPFPLTQEALADALGLSIVHVNRTLQFLRRQGLIASVGNAVRICNIKELRLLAGTAPTHL